MIQKNEQVGFGQTYDGFPVISLPSALGLFNPNAELALNQYAGYQGPMLEELDWWKELFLSWRNKNFAVCNNSNSILLERISRFFQEQLGISDTYSVSACASGKNANLTAINIAMKGTGSDSALLCTSVAHSSIKGGHQTESIVAKIHGGPLGNQIEAAEIRSLIEENPHVRMLVVTIGATHSGALDIRGIDEAFVRYLKSKKIWIHLDGTLGASRAATLPGFTVAARKVRTAMNMLQADSVCCSLYKGVGLVGGALLWLDSDSRKDSGETYFASGICLQETTVSALSFAFAGEILNRIPKSALQVFHFLSHYSTAFLYHSVMSSIGLVNPDLARETVHHIQVDSLFIECRNNKNVYDNLKRASLEVAFASFESNQGEKEGIRLVLSPDMIWDSDFVGLIGGIVSEAVLLDFGLRGEDTYTASVKSFLDAVEAMQEERLALLSADYMEEDVETPCYHFPIALFHLMDEFNFLNQLDTSEAYAEFIRFKNVLLGRLEKNRSFMQWIKRCISCCGMLGTLGIWECTWGYEPLSQVPLTGPDAFWLTQIEQYLQSHPTRL